MRMNEQYAYLNVKMRVNVNSATIKKNYPKIKTYEVIGFFL